LEKSRDLLSFLGGVIAALTGTFTTILVTELIESKKYNFESKKAFKNLYTELSDLHEEYADNLLTLQDVYYRSWRIENNIQTDLMWNEISIPQAPNTTVLELYIEKSFINLTKVQRKEIRAILYLCSKTETSLSFLMENITQEETNSVNIKNCMSELCALYHLSLNMKEEEERLKEIDKSPREVRITMLKALRIDLSVEACTSYQP